MKPTDIRVAQIRILGKEIMVVDVKGQKWTVSGSMLTLAQ